jgi:hypothetical protein
LRGKKAGCQVWALAEKEMGQRLVADVDGQEFAEEGGAVGEGAEGSVAQAGVTVEEEEEGGHALGEG